MTFCTGAYIDEMTINEIDVSNITDICCFYDACFTSKINLKNLKFTNAEICYSKSFIKCYYNRYDDRSRYLTLNLENVSFPCIGKTQKNYHLFEGDGLVCINLKNVSFGDDFDYNNMFYSTRNLEVLVADKDILDKINETPTKGGLYGKWHSRDEAEYIRDESMEIYYYDKWGDLKPFLFN